MTDDELRKEIWRYHKVLPICPDNPAHDCTFMVKSPGPESTGHYCIACTGYPNWISEPANVSECYQSNPSGTQTDRS